MYLKLEFDMQTIMINKSVTQMSLWRNTRITTSVSFLWNERAALTTTQLSNPLSYTCVDELWIAKWTLQKTYYYIYRWSRECRRNVEGSEVLSDHSAADRDDAVRNSSGLISWIRLRDAERFFFKLWGVKNEDTGRWSGVVLDGAVEFTTHASFSCLWLWLSFYVIDVALM